MRPAALVPLVLAAGCLYLGDLNEPPTVTIDPPRASSLHKGEPIAIHAQVHDDQNDPKSLYDNLHFVVAAADDLPLDDCDVLFTQAGATLTVTFYRVGTFSITVTTSDHFGAPSNSATVMFTVDETAPVFADDARPAPTTPPNGCSFFTAGEPITLALGGADPPVSDADADAQRPDQDGCATRETLRYTWRVVSMPNGAKPTLTRWQDGCVAPGADAGAALDVPDAKAQVCLWPDVGAADGSAMYAVVLEVSDGSGPTVRSPTLEVPVNGDTPPCITSTSPPAGSYVFPAGEPQTFVVNGLADDRDDLASAHYVWSLWRESDPVWHVVPMYDAGRYQLDPSSFGVGEAVRLRVEARDRVGTPAPCDLDADECAVTSCAAGVGNSCQQWKTWDFELR